MAEEKSRPIRTVSGILVATAVSKILGLVRQMLFAARFGDSAEAVAFDTASTVPLTVFDLLFASAIVGCFIPVFAAAKAESEARARRFASSFLAAVGSLTVLISVLGIVLARPLVSLLSPALSPETARLSAELLRLMMPTVVLSGLVFTFTGLLQSYSLFFLPAAVSSLSNLLLIVCLAFLKNPDEAGVRTLAVVYTASWGVQVLFLLIPALRKKLVPDVSPSLRNPDLLNAFSRAPSVLIGSWLLPVGLWLSTRFASLVSEEAITAYHYGYHIFLILGGVLVYAVCNFVFPRFSALLSAGKREEMQSALDRSLVAALLLTLPVAAGAFVLAEPIVKICYQRGAFSEELAGETAGVLAVLALAIPFYAVTEVLTRALFAAGNARVCAVSSLVAIAGCTLSNVISARFSHRLLFVSLSFLAALVLSALALGVVAGKRFGLRASLVRRALVAVSGGVLSGFFMIILLPIARRIVPENGFIGNFLLSALVFCAGFVVYSIWFIVWRPVFRETGRQ